MEIKNYIHIDFTRGKDIVVPSIQYDSGTRWVMAKLYDNGLPIDLQELKVCIMAVKSDGKEVFNECKIIDAEKGIIEFEITKQMGILVGEVECQIKLFGPDQLLSSNIFKLAVTKTLSPSSESSKDELDVLVNALGQVQDIDNRFAQTNAQLSQKANKNEVFSMANMGQDIKEAMTGGSVAVVGRDAVGEENLRDNSVTPNKIRYNGVKRFKGVLYPLKNIPRDGRIYEEHNKLNNVILDCQIFGGDPEKLYRITFISNGAEVTGKKRYSIDMFRYDSDWSNKTQVVSYNDDDNFPNQAPTEDIETRVYKLKNEDNAFMLLTIDWTALKGQINVESSQSIGYGLVIDPSCIIPNKFEVKSLDGSKILNKSIGNTKLKDSFLFVNTRISPNTNNNTLNALLPSGYMFVNPNSEGMPSNISNSICVLENIVCENRFVYQKIHAYHSPNKYYVRYFDSASESYGNWVCYDIMLIDSSLTTIKENVENLEDATQEIKEILPSKYVKQELIDKVEGFVHGWKQPDYAQSNSAYAFYNCCEGDVLRITGYSQSNDYPVIIYYDSSNTVIGRFGETYTGYSNHEIVVPKNVVKLCINSTNKNTINIDKKVPYSSIDDFFEEKKTEIRSDISKLETDLSSDISKLETDLSFEIKNVYSRILRNEKNNDFAWKPFDKTYFAFVIDDCNSFLPIAYNVFHQAGVPLSSATITSTLNKNYNGMIVKDILCQIEQEGGEILAHYSGSLTDDNTHEEWLKITREVKKTLEENGFKIRGAIRADSTANNTNKGEKYCRIYFDYADGLGKSTQYNLKRKFFIGVKTMDEMKSYIDKCCQTPGFYPFCFHGNREDEPLATEENLTELINYIKSKGSNVAELSTYRDVYDKFGTTTLEKRIALLETK